jgi:hypothetical protein
MVGQRRFEDALDESLDMLRAGAGIDACVAPYPEFAEELRAQLAIAQALLAPRAPAQPGPNAQALGRSLLLSAVAERRAIEPAAAPRGPGRLAAFFSNFRLGPASPALSAIVAIVVVGGAVMGVSAATTGSADPTAPLRNLVSSRAASELELRGTVTAVGANDITVQTTAALETVVANAATEIKDATGQPVALAAVQPGDLVQVHASRQDDGTLLAREIEVERRAPTPPEDSQPPQEDNSGPGPNSSPGTADDDAQDDKSGPANPDDDQQDDNSGPDDAGDDNGDDDDQGPGPGPGDDDGEDEGDDDESGSGPPAPPPAQTVEVEFEGTVTAVQGQQLTVVDGSRTWVVLISGSTDVHHGPLHVGDEVEVHGTRQGSGPVAAESIEIHDDDDHGDGASDGD